MGVMYGRYKAWRAKCGGEKSIFLDSAGGCVACRGSQALGFRELRESEVLCTARAGWRGLAGKATGNRGFLH